MEQPAFPVTPAEATDTPAAASAEPLQPSPTSNSAPLLSDSPSTVDESASANAAAKSEAKSEAKAGAGTDASEVREAPEIVRADPPTASAATEEPAEEAATSANLPDVPLATGSLSEILAAMGSAATPLAEASEPPADEGTAGLTSAEEAPPSKNKAPERPYPDILLQPLPRQDPLRFKWHLGYGLPSVSQNADSTEGASSEEDGAEAPASHQAGFLRLYGLLNSGDPWEARLNFADLERARDGVYIGRDPSVCRIVIPEESVSRRHAKLELAPKGLVITDQGSRNGVYVNGQQLAIYENQTPINDGDTLSLGDASLRVEINT